MVVFKNFTPHSVQILLKDTGEILQIEPSGIIARVEDKIIDNGVYVLGEGTVSLVKKAFGEVINMPEELDKNTIYIVSLMVKNTPKYKHVLNVVAPETNLTAVRDENGRIQFVTKLINYID